MSNSFFLPNKDDAGELRTDVHVMVDLETLATHSEAPIITIGAVLFDPRGNDTAEALWNRSFLRRVAIQSALQYCPKVDPGTIGWWFQQSDEAIKQLVGDDVVSLKQALVDFTRYCKDRHVSNDTFFFPGHSRIPQACLAWAKGPDFDMKILENAYKATGEMNPWHFPQYRCVRTIQDLGWPEGPDTRPVFDCGVAHDARADAVNQARMVQAAYARLGYAKEGVEYSTW